MIPMVNFLHGNGMLSVSYMYRLWRPVFIPRMTVNIRMR